MVRLTSIYMTVRLKIKSPRPILNVAGKSYERGNEALSKVIPVIFLIMIGTLLRKTGFLNRTW